MTAQKLIKSKVLPFIITSLCLVGCGQSASDSVTLNPTPYTGSYSDYKTEYSEDALVDINFESLKADLAKLQLQQTKTLTLNLPKQNTLDINFESIEFENSNIIATGHLTKNSEAQVNLIIQDETLLLTVKSDIESENLEIRSVGDGRHVMGNPTQTKETDCHVEFPHDHDSETPSEETDTLMSEGDISIMTSSSAVIDILGVYTPAALSNEGGKSAIEALFKQAILETNKAFANSKVNAQVRLVGIRELSSNETGHYSNDLAYLANRKGSSRDSYGKWDEVHAWREQLGADQVTLIGAYNSSYPSSTLGLGYKQPGDNRPAGVSSAFTVTKASAVRRYYTMTHELGHNLGLDHSDGYASSGGQFQTLIRKLGSYVRVLYFSNPNVLYKGYRTGTSSYNEAAVVARNVLSFSGLKASKY